MNNHSQSVPVCTITIGKVQKRNRNRSVGVKLTFIFNYFKLMSLSCCGNELQVEFVSLRHNEKIESSVSIKIILVIVKKDFL